MLCELPSHSTFLKPAVFITQFPLTKHVLNSTLSKLEGPQTNYSVMNHLHTKKKLKVVSKYLSHPVIPHTVYRVITQHGGKQSINPFFGPWRVDLISGTPV